MLLAGIGALIWLVRLEAAVKAADSAIREHKDDCGDRYTDSANAMREVKATIETLRVETRHDVTGLHNKLDELMRVMIGRRGGTA